MATITPKKWEIHLYRETISLSTAGYIIKCINQEDDVFVVQANAGIMKNPFCIPSRISQKYLFHYTKEAMTATVKLVQKKLARTKQPYILDTDETYFETPVVAKLFNDLMEIHPSKLSVNPIKISELNKKRRLINRIKNLEI